MCCNGFRRSDRAKYTAWTSARSLRLPSLKHRYGVVFLRCPPHSASLPRSCQHGGPPHITPTNPTTMQSIDNNTALLLQNRGTYRVPISCFIKHLPAISNVAGSSKGVAPWKANNSHY